MPILPLAVAFGIVASAFLERALSRGARAQERSVGERERERESEFIAVSLVDRSCERVLFSRSRGKPRHTPAIDLPLAQHSDPL